GPHPHGLCACQNPLDGSSEQRVATYDLDLLHHFFASATAPSVFQRPGWDPGPHSRAARWAEGATNIVGTLLNARIFSHAHEYLQRYRKTANLSLASLRCPFLLAGVQENLHSSALGGTLPQTPCSLYLLAHSAAPPRQFGAPGRLQLVRS